MTNVALTAARPAIVVCAVSASVGMTRDQQIRKALELLAPPATEREECRHEFAWHSIGSKTSLYLARSFGWPVRRKRADCCVTTLRCGGCSSPSTRFSFCELLATRIESVCSCGLGVGRSIRASARRGSWGGEEPEAPRAGGSERRVRKSSCCALRASGQQPASASPPRGCPRFC